MTYIDTFDHELVGFFAGLPLYHPTETVRAHPHADEFGCTSGQLVLGGGPGEHPALVVTDAGAAVLHFLHFWLELAHDGRLEEPNTSLAALPEAPLPERCLCFAGWHVQTYADLYDRCQSPAIPTPYDQRQHGLVEEWILGSLGEFIHFALPELAAQTLRGLPQVRRRVTRPIFYNVTILPPNFGAPAGRTHTAAGAVVWGNYPWRTARKGEKAQAVGESEGIGASR
jgi:hypothetical protein